MEDKLRRWWFYHGYKAERFIRIRLKTLMFVLLFVGIVYPKHNLNDIILGILCFITLASWIIYYLED